jgi:hypothetical protein
MDQPKKNKSKRPDTPLAATPEPASIGTNESQRQAIDSLKGSSMKIMQESRLKKSAEKAMKEVSMKRGMDIISKNQQY